MTDRPQSFSLIGAGALAAALAPAWIERGAILRTVFSRDAQRAAALAASAGAKSARIVKQIGEMDIDSDLILFAVPDQFIGSLAQDLAKAHDRAVPGLCAHASGVLPAQVLKPLAGPSTRLASMHPLLALPPALSSAVDWSSVYFGIEGDEPSIVAARGWIDRLGARSFVVQANSKALYHAAAVLASNDLVALLHEAQRCLSMAAPDAPPEALLTLAASALGALQRQRGDVARALSGPLVRGDVATVTSHLRALREQVSSGDREAENLLELYQLLLRISLPIARAARGTTRSADHLLASLEEDLDRTPPSIRDPGP